MKKSHPEKLFIVIATILASGFYGILFVLFNFETKVKATEGKNYRNLADVIMLPLEKNPTVPWQESLIASLELLDPTIMSLPNASYGFSKVRSLEFERPVREHTPFQLEIEYSPHIHNSSLVFTELIEDLLRAINVNNTLESATTLRKESSWPSLDSSVYWTDVNGTVLEHFPLVSLEQSIDGEERIATSGPTELHVIFQDDLIRVKVISSCGNPKLDELAVNSLRRYFMVKQSKSLPNAEKIADEFKGKSKIYAYWRFTREVDETMNINPEDGSDDRHWF